MKELLPVLEDLLSKGKRHDDRTGVGRISLFGPQVSFDLTKGFPAQTMRRLYWRTMAHELIWFISGKSECDYLDEHNVKIWREWTHTQKNTVGVMYGEKLRHWKSTREPGEEIDQLSRSITLLRRYPTASHNVITLWDPSTVPPYFNSDGTRRTPNQNIDEGYGAIANCHGTTIQFFGEPMSLEDNLKTISFDEVDLIVEHIREKYLKPKDQLDTFRGYARYPTPKMESLKDILEYESMVNTDAFKFYSLPSVWEMNLPVRLYRFGLRVKMYQRSQDILAIGFNIGQYALLTHMVAQVCDMKPLEYIQTWGDLHYYSNQEEEFRKLMMFKIHAKAKLWLNPEVTDINDFTINDIDLLDYQANDVDFKFIVNP